MPRRPGKFYRKFLIKSCGDGATGVGIKLPSGSGAKALLRSLTFFLSKTTINFIENKVMVVEYKCNAKIYNSFYFYFLNCTS